MPPPTRPLTSLPVSGAWPLLPPAPLLAPARAVILRAGDRLYVFSDGISEVANPAKEFFALSRLAAFLAGRAPAAPLQDLLVTLEHFHGSDRFEDDITLVEITA